MDVTLKLRELGQQVHDLVRTIPTDKPLDKKTSAALIGFQSQWQLALRENELNTQLDALDKVYSGELQANAPKEKK